MKTSSRTLNKLPIQTLSDYDEIRRLFDEICSRVAAHYGLFYQNGNPRKAQIIEVIAQTPCVSCIDRKLRDKSINRVDDFYRQCHLLACNILIEELYAYLNKLGYAVLIVSEKEIEYGKLDILIIPNRHGVSVHLGEKQVAIEVKTGFSLSLPQLMRYMLDNVDRDLVLWRIRNRQMLTFEGAKLTPLLVQFMKMIISRAERLLAITQASCDHNSEFKEWCPNQLQLQEAFSDFSGGIVKTLPSLVETVMTILNGEEASNVENNCKIC